MTAEVYDLTPPPEVLLEVAKALLLIASPFIACFLVVVIWIAVSDIRKAKQDDRHHCYHCNEPVREVEEFVWVGADGYSDCADGFHAHEVDFDPAPCCPDPGCNGRPCTFPGYAENH